VKYQLWVNAERTILVRRWANGEVEVSVRKTPAHTWVGAAYPYGKGEHMTTNAPEKLAWLDNITLDKGAHDSPENGVCALEAVAYVAGEPFTDHPACASPVLGAFLRSWNDSLNDQDRQMLKPLIPRLVGTNTCEKDEETRAWMATDWLARECAPAFLRLAGLTVQAEALEGLAALDGKRRADEAMPVLRSAQKDAAAAWDAARAAAGDAARAAAWDAAGDAAWAAAGDAAWAAAGDAAWAAARAAAGAAARAAARAAAGAALAPTVKQLQTSALLLVDRMIVVGQRS
jgi:hypothetical protein